MSIVRIGLSETKNFAEGYEAIFGKKKTADEKEPAPARKAKKSPVKARKKSAKKK